MLNDQLSYKVQVYRIWILYEYYISNLHDFVLVCVELNKSNIILIDLQINKLKFKL